MITTRRQVLVERRQILHLQVNRKHQPAVGRVLVLALVEEGDHLVRQQLVELLEDDAEVWYAVGALEQRVVVGEAVLEVHVDLRAKVDEGGVVLVGGGHQVGFGGAEPFRGALAERGDDLAADFFVERAALPEGFLWIGLKCWRRGSKR